MKQTPGISLLTPEQSTVTEKLFGVRYLAIQAKPVPGRADRRRRARTLRHRNNGHPYGG